MQTLHALLKQVDVRAKSKTKATKHPLLSYLSLEGITRLEKGHPWIRASDINSEWRIPLETQAIHLGEHWFLYDKNSALPLRRLGPSTRHWLYNVKDISPDYVVSSSDFEKIFRDSLKEIFLMLWNTKKQLYPDESSFRWCFGDADEIPGLVLDVFDKSVITEITHPIWKKHWKWLSELLKEISLKGIFSAPEDMWISWNSLQWKLSSKNSHKTGMYLDQRDNHNVVSGLAESQKTKKAWDLFCYVGGFSLHLAKAGVKVIAVDSSSEALQTLNDNADKNNLKNMIATVKEDVFDWVNTQKKQGELCDLIILDPPSLAPKSKDIESATNALRELMRNSLACLSPGGLLVVCVCSHHISHEKLLSAARSAAHLSRRTVKELNVLSQAADHAPNILLPESKYLTGSVLQVL